MGILSVCLVLTGSVAYISYEVMIDEVFSGTCARSHAKIRIVHLGRARDALERFPEGNAGKVEIGRIRAHRAAIRVIRDGLGGARKARDILKEDAISRIQEHFLEFRGIDDRLRLAKTPLEQEKRADERYGSDYRGYQDFDERETRLVHGGIVYVFNR